jgi:hypothetical protein
MFEIQNYASFVAAIIVFQLIPGPGTLAILNATARNGIGAGLGAVVGTLLGDMVYMVAAIVGLAAVMNAHPVLFQGLQWFGAAYLGWMGLQLLFRPVATASAAEEARKSAWVYFRQAFAVSLTNPKVMLFFCRLLSALPGRQRLVADAGGDDGARHHPQLSLPGGSGARWQRGGAQTVVAALRAQAGDPSGRRCAARVRCQAGAGQSLTQARRTTAFPGEGPALVD